MAASSKLPAVGLLEAVQDERLLGSMPLLPVQLELLDAVEGCVRVAWCVGRRSGKSTLAAVVLAWAATLRPQLRDCVQPGERVYHLAVATSREQARLILHAARRLIRASPVLCGLIERETDEAIYLSNGSTIAAFPCSSRTTRGWPVATLALDELAFFQTGDEGPAAAANVYRALTPSLVTFGDARRLILSSTPNGPGFFKDRFDAEAAAEDAGDTRVCAVQLPTWEVRPDIPQSLFDEERDALGEELFSAEFGAQFLASGGALLSEADIRSCVVPGGDLSPREVVDAVVGLDVGYRRDRSAAVVLGRHPADPQRLRVAAIRTWAPTDDALGVERHAESVLAEVAELAQSYGHAPIHADTYESVTTRARLEAHGAWVELTGTGAGRKGAMYRELAARIRLGQIEYPDEARLIAELRRLRANYRGSSPTVESPRSGDSHGDVVAALAQAVFALSAEGGGPVGAVLTEPPSPYDGTGSGGYYDDGCSNPIDSWSFSDDW